MKLYVPGFSLLTTGMLRYLDRIIGKPTTFMFFLLKKIFRRKRRIEELQNKKLKKILIIKLRWIGSIILMSWAINNLKKIYPDAKIHFLTKKWLHKIYGNELFDKTYSLNTWWIVNAIKDFIIVPYMLLKEKYDLIIDFEVVSYYTAALTFLLRPQYSIWYKIIGKTKDKLYDFNCIYHESKHITEIFGLPLKLLWKIDIDYDLIPPNYATNDENKVFNQIEDVKDYIAINVNASDLAYERRRPAPYYAEIINHLSKNWEKILLVWSNTEKTYVESIYNSLSNKDNVINIAGEYTLSQLFVIIKNVKLFITNDSWPLHIAVAYQTPTISFFWPETPIIYWPNFHKEKHHVFFLNLFCSPCISVFRDKNFVCENQNKCMFGITPKVVLTKISEILLNKANK